MSSQKQKLLEASHEVRRPYLPPHKHTYEPPQRKSDLDRMSVDDEQRSLPDLDHSGRHQQQEMEVARAAAPMHVKAKDLRDKDSYLFFELFSLYTKNQLRGE